MNIACANSCIVYNMIHPNDLILLDFKIIVLTYLIGRYTSRSRAPPDGKTSCKRKYQTMGILLQRKNYDLKTYAKCAECGIFLCLNQELCFSYV